MSALRGREPPPLLPPPTPRSPGRVISSLPATSRVAFSSRPCGLRIHPILVWTQVEVSRMKAERKGIQSVHPRSPALLKQGKVRQGTCNRDEITATHVVSDHNPSTIVVLLSFPSLPSFHPRRPFRSGAFVWPPRRRSIYFPFPFPTTAATAGGRQDQECVAAACDQCT